MDIDPICAGAKALGHSWWPSPRWWFSLTASDQGAWVSGLGAFAAASAALLVAGADRRERKRQRLELARVAAQYLYADVQKLVIYSGLAQHALRRLAKVAVGSGYGQEMFALEDCLTQLKGIVDRAGLERISLLPANIGGPIAASLGGFPVVVDSSLITLGHLKVGYPIDDFRGSLGEHSEDFKPMVENLLPFFIWYADQFPSARQIALQTTERLREILGDGMEVPDKQGL